MYSAETGWGSPDVIVTNNTAKGARMPIEVRVTGDIEKALRILKKKVQRDGLHRELKRRKFFEKPSVKKKRKRAEAKRRKLKSMRRNSF